MESHIIPSHPIRSLKYDTACAGKVPGEAGAVGNAEMRTIEGVRSALRATGRPALQNLLVERCAGGIVLWGEVPSYYQKQLAQETAGRLAGKLPILNEIAVVPLLCAPADNTTA